MQPHMRKFSGLAFELAQLLRASSSSKLRQAGRSWTGIAHLRDTELQPELRAVVVVEDGAESVLLQRVTDLACCNPHLLVKIAKQTGIR